MRESAILPEKANGVVAENRAQLRKLLAKNIAAEKPRMDASAIADIVLSFFSGLCIEHNLVLDKAKSGKAKSGKASPGRKIENFMTALRSL
jgi:hypothetical protein